MAFTSSSSWIQKLKKKQGQLTVEMNNKLQQPVAISWFGNQWKWRKRARANILELETEEGHYYFVMKKGAMVLIDGKRYCTKIY